MSADNGYILRRNADGKYVVQMYFASADEYPPIDDERAAKFDTLEEAVFQVEEWEQEHPSEYGLTTLVKSRRVENEQRT